MTSSAFPVRLSHLLRHCSVGSIVRGPDRLFVVHDARKWYASGPPESAEIRYVDRVRAALNIDCRLYAPPVGTVGETGEVTSGAWIPAGRFPRWTRCTRCGLMYYRPWQGREPHEDLRCSNRSKCDGVLEQVPYVLVHEAGYLADVPWHSVAHRNTAKNCQEQCSPDMGGPYLKIKHDQGRIKISCTRNGCGGSETLPQRLMYPQTAWQQPWVPSPPTESLDHEKAWLLEINDVRVHASVTSTALVIPPESRIRKGTVVDRIYSSSDKQLQLRRSGLLGRSARRRTARELRCSEVDIERALNEIDMGYPLYGHLPESGDLLAGEFSALIEPIPDLFEDEDFVTKHHTKEWRALIKQVPPVLARSVRVVSRLIEVQRLKEIVVLRGFTRLGGERIIPPDITGESGWLPSLSLRGEGIFLTLDEKVLETWARQKHLQERAETMRARCQAAPLRGALASYEEVSPHFVLLHTLAHLVIRQLGSESGYGAASIKERIYCSIGAAPMAGILIYVSVPDDIGSLGGLVELAEPRKFLRILAAAFDSATWCSLDPICSEHGGQGPDLLNGAACQACALVADPTCQYGNVLLDRTFIKGNDEVGTAPLLDFTRSQG